MRPSREAALLVEGPDDKWSLIALVSSALKAEGLAWDDCAWRPDVQDKGGAESLLESLPVALKSLPRLGVVLDADEDRDARWMSLRDRLHNIGLSLPDAPPADGYLGPGLLPGSRLGVWLMPDNLLPGTVEDFLARLVPAADPCWPHAAEAVQTALSLRPASRNAAWKSKAQLHTWLAWGDRPGQPLGQAITARVLSQADHPTATAFVRWFFRLFRPDVS